jgi:hypothetical protein
MQISVSLGGKTMIVIPSNDCSFPTADLKSCSNFAWSSTVKKDNLIFGILELATDDVDAGGVGAGVD